MAAHAQTQHSDPAQLVVDQMKASHELFIGQVRRYGNVLERYEDIERGKEQGFLGRYLDIYIEKAQTFIDDTAPKQLRLLNAYELLQADVDSLRQEIDVMSMKLKELEAERNEYRRLAIEVQRTSHDGRGCSRCRPKNDSGLREKQHSEVLSNFTERTDDQGIDDRPAQSSESAHVAAVVPSLAPTTPVQALADFHVDNILHESDYTAESDEPETAGGSSKRSRAVSTTPQDTPQRPDRNVRPRSSHDALSAQLRLSGHGPRDPPPDDIIIPLRAAATSGHRRGSAYLPMPGESSRETFYVMPSDRARRGQRPVIKSAEDVHSFYIDPNKDVPPRRHPNAPTEWVLPDRTDVRTRGTAYSHINFPEDFPDGAHKEVVDYFMNPNRQSAKLLFKLYEVTERYVSEGGPPPCVPSGEAGGEDGITGPKQMYACEQCVKRGGYCWGLKRRPGTGLPATYSKSKRKELPGGTTARLLNAQLDTYGFYWDAFIRPQKDGSGPGGDGDGGPAGVPQLVEV